jgi:hypothetical protein
LIVIKIKILKYRISKIVSENFDEGEIKKLIKKYQKLPFSQEKLPFGELKFKKLKSKYIFEP